ncbi:GNAT family N-acetyltransferase [Anthocerotibacter panamensis]|uniref:GNAT family N-acetyltransferase n=1 Tax=Anthocerotibacter panamensis TaxID=2857077 RepID=UPI001C4047AC|nr:GNAT family N-acetyltransferase [Anthocerotibacter panamensis]
MSAMLLIRKVQFLDLEAIAQLTQGSRATEHAGALLSTDQVQAWYGPVRLLSLFPNRHQHLFDVYVAQVEGKVEGMIQVSPVNVTQTTWRIDRLIVNDKFSQEQLGLLLMGHVFEYNRNARTWILEANIHDKSALALYRENGFQSLAEQSYWYLCSENLEELAGQESTPVQLLPVSNADAHLICELDTATMPPIVRNVYNRHLDDFRRNYVQRLSDAVGRMVKQQERVFRYVYEPQRRVAIGAFDLYVQKEPGTGPHRVRLWVHPAYTWLYAPLMHTLAKITRHYPHIGLEVASADYQPEREAYLASLEAEVVERTLLMSRSVWHKVRESRNPLENLSIPDMLPNWQPARNPLPNRVQHQEPDSPQPPQTF